MQVLFQLLIIILLLFWSHYITSYYTYTIVAGIKSGNYAINFFDSRLGFFFWLVINAVFLAAVVLSSAAVIKSRGNLNFNSFSYNWFWFSFVGLSLVTSIYWFGGILINMAHKISLVQFGAAYPSVIVNLICIIGVITYNMYKLVGEMPNKYGWATLVFAVTTTICATLSIKQYIK